MISKLHCSEFLNDLMSRSSGNFVQSNRYSHSVRTLTTFYLASKHVEHAVGRSSKAHPLAREGGRAGGGERRPRVGCRAEAVEVVVVDWNQGHT
jgi:hypothetical protein